MKTKCVVKRRGHVEEYDERKVYGSVYAACLINEYPEKKCEDIARKISERVTKWIKSEMKRKTCVGSRGIFRLIIKELKKVNKDAAYVYETHMDVN